MEKRAFQINHRIKDVIGSTTLAITASAKELKAQGKDVVNFGAGEPDFDTPEPIKQSAIQAIHQGLTKYTPSVGTQDLRQAISAKFKKDNNLDYSVKQIAVSCGAKHALYNLIQILADDNDEVLIPAPYWVSYPEMVKMAGAVPRLIPTTAKTNFKITPELLSSAVSKKTRVLIMNSPSNPTGVVYRRQELELLAEICVRRGIVIVSDEIYEKLIYDNEKHVSTASLGRDVYDLTVTVNGVSKTYSMTGWRIGYSAGPQEIMDYVNKFQDHSTSNPSSISQAAALEALKSPPETIEAMRLEFSARRDVMLAALSTIPQIRVIRPQGAFYVFCDVSAFGDSATFAQRLLDQAHVALIPGDGFGAPGFVRLSFTTSRERILEGIKRLGQWIQNNDRT